MKTAPEYLSIREAADELGASSWVIWRACRIGSIPASRPGAVAGRGRYLIKRADLEAYRRACMTPPRPRAIEFQSQALLIDRMLGRRRA